MSCDENPYKNDGGQALQQQFRTALAHTATAKVLHAATSVGLALSETFAGAEPPG